jgi:Ca-activated chloride channel homolog
VNVRRSWLRWMGVVVCCGQAITVVPAQELTAPQLPLDRPTFTTSVKLVSVAAVVRDQQGRVVRGLSKQDFQVLEKGVPRSIVNFGADDQGPISLAILFDSSGSMHLGANLKAGQQAVRHLLSWIEPRADEVSLFGFDKVIRQEVPFTQDADDVRAALDRMKAGGSTSLYDAVAQAAKTLSERPSPRRALVVITDGVDTSSELTPAEVARLASEVDVPVYVIAVVLPIDHPGGTRSLVDATPVTTRLAALAEGTGGKLMVASAPAHASVAARELISELRHQYLLAVEAARAPGWYSLDVRTLKRDLTVRARSGYVAGSTSGDL